MRMALLVSSLILGCSSSSEPQTSAAADSGSDVEDAIETSTAPRCCPVEGPFCGGGCFYAGGPDYGSGCPEICDPSSSHSKLVDVGGCPKVVLANDSSCSATDASTHGEVGSDADLAD